MIIRELTSGDREALARFSCARVGEPWSEVVQDEVRRNLPDRVASGDASAVGLFDEDGRLRGVAAWQIHDTSQVVLCRGHIVAVAVGEQGKGHGRRLKEAMIAAAESAGAAAVASIVHRRNLGMVRLNERLGAIIEEIPDDPDHCRCFISLDR